MSFGIASVTAITVICYLACEAVKTTKLDTKFVPIIAGVLGGNICPCNGVFSLFQYVSQGTSRPGKSSVAK